eukprot:g1100.t1
MRLPPARILSVIPARYGSQRFPGKPLALIGGRPMVARTLEAVKQASLVDRVVVATDDDRIRVAVEAAGGEAVMTGSGHRSGTDRVAEVAGLPEFAGYDVIVNVQGDEPGIDPRHVDRCCEALLSSAASPPATAQEGEAPIPKSHLEQAESLEQLRVLEAGYGIQVAVVDSTLPGIDTPEDLKAFEKTRQGIR